MLPKNFFETKERPRVNPYTAKVDQLTVEEADCDKAEQRKREDHFLALADLRMLTKGSVVVGETRSYMLDDAGQVIPDWKFLKAEKRVEETRDEMQRAQAQLSKVRGQ